MSPCHLDVLSGRALPDQDAAPAGLLDALAQVSDPRDPRGERYGFVSVLAVAVCATLAGARSYTALNGLATPRGAAG